MFIIVFATKKFITLSFTGLLMVAPRVVSVPTPIRPFMLLFIEVDDFEYREILSLFILFVVLLSEVSNVFVMGGFEELVLINGIM